MAKNKAEAKREFDQAVKWMKTHMLPEEYVWTVVRHTTPNATWVTLLAIIDGDIVDITYHAARIMGVQISPKWGGLKVTDQGTRPGWAAVHDLSIWLWGAENKDLHFFEATI